MNRKLLILVIAAIAIAVLGLLLIKKSQDSPESSKPAPALQVRTSNPSSASTIPAHYDVAPAAGELRAVLSASQYTGKTRAAYESAKAIPTLLAQMPCYCHCDRGMGHKSLHSCFEDDHAAHCATCVDEALMTYELQKRGLNPQQIRDKIIAEFSGD